MKVLAFRSVVIVLAAVVIVAGEGAEMAADKAGDLRPSLPPQVAVPIDGALDSGTSASTP